MLLKRLELSGFKSFADKTELEFVRGITAVVGPNGSGKSNISDSIRWVLGEQSAKSLRGGKMEDVIFAGSSMRKPVNIGEVSITFDNTDGRLGLDFQEVVVTRRVSRTGDSEYLINKQPCRLKDIAELFMDTGIGKEAYSNIGQGRIDEILSSRSEDRRGIFEEASGIVKYKSRKKEAMRKLEDTEHNLLRIHDLTSELEAQLEPMRDQAEKAARYKELKGRLESTEISLYVHNIDTVHAAWLEASTLLTQLQTEQITLSTAVNVKDAELASERQQMRAVEDEIEGLQAKLLGVSEEVEKTEGQQEVLRERLRNVQQNKLQYEVSIGSLRERISHLAAEEEQWAAKSTSITAEIDAVSLKLLALEEQMITLVRTAGGADREALANELRDRFARMTLHRNEIRYAQAQDESIRAQLIVVEQELAQAEAEFSAIEERASLSAAEHSELHMSLESVREQYRLANQNVWSAAQALEQHTASVSEGERRLQAIISRRDTMKEMQEDFDGFMQGVREVMKASAAGGSLQGVHGAVASLITVPESMETAIDVALGAAAQHLVMTDEATTREAIRYLREKQVGRATFLPLDVIKARTVGEQDLRTARAMPGFVGIAASKLTFEDRYRNIIDNLLGNVLLAENLEQANKIARALNFRYRVVTLIGDVVHAGGSQTGGSQQRKGANLLGRKRQIEELEEQFTAVQTELDTLRRKRASLESAHTDALASLEAVRSEGEQHRLTEQAASTALAQLASERERLALLTEKLRSTVAERQAQLQHYAAVADSERLKLAAIEFEEARLQQQKDDEDSRLEESESSKQKLQDEQTALRIERTKVETELKGLHEQIDRVRADISRTKADLTHAQHGLEFQLAEERQTNTEFELQQTRLEHLQLQKAQTQETLDFRRARRAELMHVLERGEESTRDQRAELRKVDEQLRQTEVKANRNDVELEGLLRNLSEEYGLSYEYAKQNYPAPTESEALIKLQHEVRDLKREVQGLGEVNVGAIEEYARLKERHDFLAAQQTDLMEAKQKLYDVIAEMDEEMSKRFKETFQTIREHFHIVFARLFGGGRADLTLVDPDNVLESGIEVIAQPPGKKLQNLQLLSGGERALTALALLFSILHVKPVPFCVLDEVEAALDEANVARFASYLRDFSEQTQFIVVTHRKGTMEEADVLYGVTMEEGGVSKLVSVKLEEDEVFV